ncbi:long-chain fatty acid transport protein 1-like, partial [Puntigrus tetrazona]|uniref:long-chain fatty acid transport protein 1-like n=1 Tax=Puntigrus tetrazona TaxID=1606681 RepID=UPI001C8926AE
LALWHHIRHRNTIPSIFAQTVARHPDKPALVYEATGETWTFSHLDQISNAVAQWALSQGWTSGDVVALFMESRPLQVALWLGLAKVGVEAALINFNLRRDSLLHCMGVSASRALVFGAELADAVYEVSSSLSESMVRFSTGDLRPDQMAALKCHPLDSILASAPRNPPLCTVSKGFNDRLFYIYTSGTTGLPKAAIVVHSRYYRIAAFGYHSFRMQPDDIIYDCLPLYHSAGNIMGVGQCLIHGITVVVKKKFSASRFWEDCIKHHQMERFKSFIRLSVLSGITVVLRRKFSVSEFWNDCREHEVTVIQYIGEVMRYLCNAPKSERERDHRVRLALGIGIRADTWEDFLRRFGNVCICECYGATEGNIGFINYTGKTGSIGRVTAIHKMLTPYAFIRFNPETEEPLRDSNGLCVEVSPGETGLLVAKINKIAPFSGYAKNPAQTEKKKLRNVFKRGDVYFNTGDLILADRDGFLYFQDRVGDTFRWKGENVATTEVSEVLLMLDSVEAANVYGVRVSGHEGRIGMAALKLRDGKEFDRSATYTHLKKLLPAYARPHFIRIQVTHTHEHTQEHSIIHTHEHTHTLTVSHTITHTL